MNTTAIIIDDELRARKLLSGMLNEYVPQVNVLEECADLAAGVKAIRKLKPNLVFLDIEMPGHSGLELLDFFNEDEINFEIIFTTAYNQYAINAFKLSAIDYLLKPIDSEELINAINRFDKKQNSLKSSISTLSQNLNNNDSNKIAVPVGQSFKFIELSNILYLKADSSYTEIYFNDESKLIVSRTLKNFEDILGNNKLFFRSHKSYMVNFNAITEYVKSDGGYLLLSNKTQIPISPEKVQDLLNLIQAVKR